MDKRTDMGSVNQLIIEEGILANLRDSARREYIEK